MMRARFFAIFLSLLTGAAAARADAWQQLEVPTSEGVRNAIVIPADPAPAPTLIVLHGATISAELTAHLSGFAEAAAKRGFSAVFPEGIYKLWNDGRGDRLSSSDDVGFLRALTAELVRRGVADPARIYLAGISNGGMMTLRMLCEAPELFAGAATIIASMPGEAGAGCRLRKPMPVVMFNGTADPLVPYRGGGVGFGGTRGSVWGAEKTAAFFAKANGCPRRIRQALTTSAQEAIRVVRLGWSGCTSGQAVVLYRIEGGGHQLFGHTNVLPAIFGRGTTQLSAPEITMALFGGE